MLMFIQQFKVGSFCALQGCLLPATVCGCHGLLFCEKVECRASTLSISFNYDPTINLGF